MTFIGFDNMTSDQMRSFILISIGITIMIVSFIIMGFLESWYGRKNGNHSWTDNFGDDHLSTVYKNGEHALIELCMGAALIGFITCLFGC